MDNKQEDKITPFVEEGVMFLKDGLAWGITYEDGQCTEKGWTDPADARKVKVYNPEFVREASSITAAFCFDPDLEEIEKGTLVRVRRTTTVEILPNKKDDRNWRCFAEGRDE